MFRPEDDNAYESLFMDPYGLPGRALHRDRAGRLFLDGERDSKAPWIRHESRAHRRIPVGDLALCAGDPDRIRSSPGRQYLYFVERDSAAAIGSVDSTSIRRRQKPTVTRPNSYYTQARCTIKEKFDSRQELQRLFSRPAGVFQVLAVGFDGSWTASVRFRSCNRP